jgi:ribonuclease E
MSKELVINAVVPEDVRVAVLQDGRLEHFFEETQDRFNTRSNIYLGKVVSVESSLEACFVDFGESKQGFLPFDEILPIYRSDEQGGKGNNSRRSKQPIRHSQTLIVQVDKEPVGEKGSRLTTYLSLAGRYLVLTPYSTTRGVSRKIEDPEERQKHRKLVANLDPPKDSGIILRTAAFGTSKRDLARDLNYLIRLWKDLQAKAKQASQPGLLHSEVNLIRRVLRDYYTNDMDRIWIDETNAHKQAKMFVKLYLPRKQDKLKMYTDRTPIFTHFEIERQIEAIHNRKVSLPSGGGLVIEQTEALVAIDVNSGKTRGCRDQEENAYETNKEAAVEITRQLRLRNLGGIIVIDFIDMTVSGHRTAVERILRDGMRYDKARHQIGKISAFGLGTLTRQRLDQAIRLVGYRECPTCQGDGIIRAPDATAVRLIRSLQAGLADGFTQAVRVSLHPTLANHLQNKHRSDILALEREYDVKVEIEAVPELDLSSENIEFVPKVAEPKDPKESKDLKDLKDPGTAKPKRKRRRRKNKSRRQTTVESKTQLG